VAVSVESRQQGSSLDFGKDLVRETINSGEEIICQWTPL